MRPLIAVLALAATTLAPIAGQGQQPVRSPSAWSLEFNMDGNFPTAKLGDAALDFGLGFGGTVRYQLMRHLQGYAGWEWHQLRSDELRGSEEIDIEVTGYAVGLRFEHPFRGEGGWGQGAGYWVRAGGLIEHLELEDEDGDPVTDTKHGLGWEAGGGLALPLNTRISLTPGVRYRSLARELTIGSTTRDVTLRYVTATVGVAIGF
jgi:hypothetical protein